MKNDNGSSFQTHFPFTAIVGQERMKRALLFNAIDPSIGGVLICGTRGTAKTTTVRALARLLPRIEMIPGDPFNSPPKEGQESVLIPTPFVNLPLGTTEDRVLGSLDVEQILKIGKRSFQPGLLARANRGILYIDEVNLLADHLVDLLLDAVATGVNRIEREGVSFEHPARVILVGTMNPEEGELRPQLLDRFGLCVQAEPYMEPAERMEVVRRRIAFDADPIDFVQRWSELEKELGGRVEQARILLPQVSVSRAHLETISEMCLAAQVEGLRADIVMYKTARAIAAFEGRSEVKDSDIEEAEKLALEHRRRARPGGSPPSKQNPSASSSGFSHERTPTISSLKVHKAKEMPCNSSTSQQELRRFEIGSALAVPLKHKFFPTKMSSPYGKGSSGTPSRFHGTYVRTRFPRPGEPLDLALEATIRAASLDSTPQGWNSLLRVQVKPEHLRVKQRHGRTRNLVVFVVDASGSMAAAKRMSAAKAVVCSLLEEAYKNRDSVALICFRGEQAHEILPPTRSPVFAYKRLRELLTGGRTPLAAGLRLARNRIERELLKDATVRPFLVLITDGHPTAPDGSAFAWTVFEAESLRRKQLDILCIDTESGSPRLYMTPALAQCLGATYFHISNLPQKELGAIVREWIARG